MSSLTRFQKEQALRAAGVQVRQYPRGDSPSDVGTAIASDWALLRAGTQWEDEVDRLYAELHLAREDQPAPEIVEGYAALCARDGAASALNNLNGGVPHRYTAVYRLVDGKLRNLELVDKLGEPRPGFLADVPLASSFCQYVVRDGQFVTTDSGQDARLNGHPYQGAMSAYHGVPVVSAAGVILGSLCHFDTSPQALTDDQFARLRALARVLSAFLPT